jgi:hypothetical protein
MTRIVSVVVGALVALAFATESHATLNACSSAKQACVAKKTAALLKCHSKNSKPPAGLDPAKFATCKQKAKDKFDGGANPAKGCFAKLEAKYGVGGCLTSGDVAALEAQVDDYVDAVICALDPAAGTCPVVPTPIPTSTPTGCFPNGAVCANASQCCSTNCASGTCAPSCANGFQDGTETGIDCGGSDCSPCQLGGGCGTNDDCAATTACASGTCVCAVGLSDCNGSPGDGCEANTSSDVSNCGGCNNQCSFPNATPACTSSVCQIGGCVPSYADCDGMPVTGCEVYTDGDATNCGSCGNVCPGMQTCVNGFCQ